MMTVLRELPMGSEKGRQWPEVVWRDWMARRRLVVCPLRSVSVERALDINQQETEFLFILSDRTIFFSWKGGVGSQEGMVWSRLHQRYGAHLPFRFQDFELIYVNLFQIYSSDISSTIWGHLDFRLPPLYAAFVNGVAVSDALLFALKSR